MANENDDPREPSFLEEVAKIIGVSPIPGASGNVGKRVLTVGAERAKVAIEDTRKANQRRVILKDLYPALGLPKGKTLSPTEQSLARMLSLGQDPKRDTPEHKELNARKRALQLPYEDRLIYEEVRDLPLDQMQEMSEKERQRAMQIKNFVDADPNPQAQAAAILKQFDEAPWFARMLPDYLKDAAQDDLADWATSRYSGATISEEVANKEQYGPRDRFKELATQIFGELTWPWEDQERPGAGTGIVNRVLTGNWTSDMKDELMGWLDRVKHPPADWARRKLLLEGKHRRFTSEVKDPHNPAGSSIYKEEKAILDQDGIVIGWEMVEHFAPPPPGGFVEGAKGVASDATRGYIDLFKYLGNVSQAATRSVGEGAVELLEPFAKREGPEFNYPRNAPERGTSFLKRKPGDYDSLQGVSDLYRDSAVTPEMERTAERIEAIPEAVTGIIDLMAEGLWESLKGVTSDPGGTLRDKPLDFLLWFVPAMPKGSVRGAIRGLLDGLAHTAPAEAQLVRAGVRSSFALTSAGSLEVINRQAESVMRAIEGNLDLATLKKGGSSLVKRGGKVDRSVRGAAAFVERNLKKLQTSLGELADRELQQLTIGGLHRGRRQANPALVKIAENIAKKFDLPTDLTNTGQVHVDEVFGKRVADFYEAMRHNPNDPATAKAYALFRQEIKSQYDELIAEGYTIETWLDPGQPYANSSEMRWDVMENKHLYIKSETKGLPVDHPLNTPFQGVGSPTYNDAFQAVHQIFGNAMHGATSGERGRVQAYLSHSRMFSELARRAMATETLGRGGAAAQKAGLLPQAMLEEAGSIYANAGIRGTAAGQPVSGATGQVAAQQGGKLHELLTRAAASLRAGEEGGTTLHSVILPGLTQEQTNQALAGAAHIAAGVTDKRVWGELMRDAYGEGIAVGGALEKIWKHSSGPGMGNAFVGVGAAKLTGAGVMGIERWRAAMRADFGDAIDPALTEKAYKKAAKMYGERVDEAGEYLKDTTAMLDQYHAGQVGEHWYTHEPTNLEHFFGDDWLQMTGFLSGTSAHNDTHNNLLGALKIHKKWKLGMDEQLDNLFPIHAKAVDYWLKNGTMDPKHRKMFNFQLNLAGSEEAFTGDVWMGRAFGMFKRNPDGSPARNVKGVIQDLSINDSRYTFMETRIRDLSTATGIPVSRLQAAIWTATKQDWVQRGWSPASTLNLKPFGEMLSDAIQADPIVASLIYPERHAWLKRGLRLKIPKNLGPVPPRATVDIDRRVIKKQSRWTEQIYHQSGKDTDGEFYGFTFNPSRGTTKAAGNMLGKPRYAVSIFPERKRVIVGHPDAADIESFLFDNRDLFVDQRTNAGAWFKADPNGGPGQTILDISLAIPDEGAVIKIGNIHRQEAYFDLQEVKEVFLDRTQKTVKAAPSKGREARTAGLSYRQNKKGTVIAGVENIDSITDPKTGKLLKGVKPQHQRLSDISHYPDAEVVLADLESYLTDIGRIPAQIRNGFINRKLLTGLGGSVMGTVIAKELSDWIDGNEEGSRLSIRQVLWGTFMGFGATRFLTDPRLRTALKRFTSIDKRGGEPNLEEVFSALVEPWLPDRVVSGSAIDPTMILGGAAAGAAVSGMAPGETEFDPYRAVVGGIAGGMLGGHAAASIGRLWPKNFNPRKTWGMVVKEGANAPPEYLAWRKEYLNRTAGLVREVRDVAEGMSKLIRKSRTQAGRNPAKVMGEGTPIEGEQLPFDLGEMMDDVIRGNSSPDILPPDAKALAIQMRSILDRNSLMMIEVGLATGELAEIIQTGLGKYFPRLYLKWEKMSEPMMEVAKWAQAQKIPLHKLSDRNYLKSRADIPPHIRKLMGEITDNPAYVLGKTAPLVAADIEFTRFANRVAASEWVLADDLISRGSESVDDYLKRTGNARPADEAGMKVLKAELEAQAPQKFQGPLGAESYHHGDKVYRKLTGKKYGALNNQFLLEEVAMDIETFHAGSEGFRKFIDTTTGLFKGYKVTMNPATLARNFYGMLIMNDQGGLSPVRFGHYRKALQDYMGSSPAYIEARNAGLFGGEFYPQEVASMLGTADRLGDANAMTFMFKWLGEQGRKPLDQMGRLHAATDHFGKQAMYNLGRSRGMGTNEAVEFAKRWVFDYRETPKWVNVMKRSPFGAPFISFSYKSIPRVMENMFAVGDPRKLWRFWKYPAMLGAVNEYSMHKHGLLEDAEHTPIDHLRRIALSGLGIDHREAKVKRLLPDHLGSLQILLPSRDTYSRLNYDDMTWKLPWGDFSEMGQGQVGKTLEKAHSPIPFPRMLEPTHPMAQIACAALSGKDCFTGKDISRPGADTLEAQLDHVRWFARLFGPPWVPGAGYSAEKVRKAFSEDVVSSPHNPSKKDALASSLFGLVTHPQDPRQAHDYKAWELRTKIDEIKSEIRRIAMRSGDPKRINQRTNKIRQLEQEFKEKYGDRGDLPATPQKLLDAIAAAATKRGQQVQEMMEEIAREEAGQQ